MKTLAALAKLTAAAFIGAVIGVLLLPPLYVFLEGLANGF